MPRIAVALITLLSLGAPPATARAADREWHRYRAICEKLYLDAIRRTPLAEDPPVLTTAPEGQKTRVSLELRPVRPAGTSFPLASLMASVSQANKLIKAQVGFLSFAAPSMKAVLLVYPPGTPQTERLTAPGLERSIAADAQGHLRIPRDERLEAAGARVELSAPPLRFELDE
jgi:hypothetical protein